MIDLETLRRTAESTPPAELPDLLGALETIRAIAMRRLLAPEPPPTSSTEGELITAQDMAARLSIQPSWLLDQARQGRVPHTRIGKYVRFAPAAVLAAMKAQDS